MFIEEVPLDHQYVLNLSENIFGKNASIFPVVDTYITDKDNFNQVTFVFLSSDNQNKNIFLSGDFDALYKKFKLHQVLFENTPTRIFAITLKIPVKQLFHYKFSLNEKLITDPLNPVIKNLENDAPWSVFFTEYYKTAVIFENWELAILQRFISYLLPFKTNEFQNFVKHNSAQFDNITKSLASQLGYDIGTVNFIDKIIAKQERHHIVNYKICLKEIKRILLQLNRFQEPEEMDEYFYHQIYRIMKENDFHFWNKNVYENPSYFIKILRRHIITAAFSHPKYGGNTGAIGWKFLDSLLHEDNNANSGFDWQQALEKPLGTNNDYFS